MGLKKVLARSLKGRAVAPARFLAKNWRATVETLTLCAVVAYTVVACGQLQQMRLATKATKESADAAAIAANVAKKTLQQSEDFSSKGLAQTRDQTKSMDTSAHAAEESARVASLALRISERAYVGLENGNGANFARGSVGTVNLILKNTGHTPALDCQTWGSAGIIGRNQGIVLPTRRAVDTHGGSTLHPGAGYILRSGADYPYRLSAAQVQGIKTGTLRYYFLVSFTYRDVFSPKLHHTLVCRQVGTDLVTTIPCPEITDRDD